EGAASDAAARDSGGRERRRDRRDDGGVCGVTADRGRVAGTCAAQPEELPRSVDDHCPGAGAPGVDSNECHFNAPCETEVSRRFWKMTYTMSTGRIVITAAAKSAPKSTLNPACTANTCMPWVSTDLLGSVIRMTGSRYWFHSPTKFRSAIADMPGPAIGSITEKNVRHWEAPSMAAASAISWGRRSKNAVRKSTVKGRAYAAYVTISPAREFI